MYGKCSRGDAESVLSLCCHSEGGGFLNENGQKEEKEEKTSKKRQKISLPHAGETAA